MPTTPWLCIYQRFPKISNSSHDMPHLSNYPTAREISGLAAVGTGHPLIERQHLGDSIFCARKKLFSIPSIWRDQKNPQAGIKLCVLWILEFFGGLHRFYLYPKFFQPHFTSGEIPTAPMWDGPPTFVARPPCDPLLQSEWVAPQQARFLDSPWKKPRKKNRNFRNLVGKVIGLDQKCPDGLR